MTPHHENRFVAHFDMLGMSALTKRDPDLAWEKLSALSWARDERMHLGIERLDTGELIVDQVRSLIFSDTLVAFSKGNTQNDVMALLLLTTEVFTRALHYCIPLRGGVAHGRFNFNLDLNLFSGPALVDAHAIGESSQWLGVIVDDYTAEVAKSIPLRSATGKEVIVQWDVPMKDGPPARRHAVNWVQTHRHNYCGPIPLTIEAFYSPLATLFGPLETLAPSIRLKYENTVEFFNAHYDLAGAP